MWQAELPFALPRPADGETSGTVALEDRIVPYLLSRGRRRTIGLTIDHRGLRVGAPTRASLAEVENLIRKHAAWVRQKLDEWRERRRPEPLRVVDGMRLPYLGGELEIGLVVNGDNRLEWSDSLSAPALTLYPRSAEKAEALLATALRRRALLVFRARFSEYAARLGIAPPRLALSSARTRWGSCSSKTGIRLNWRLIHCEMRLIDYVIVHELSHLSEMNHSARFWAIVEKYFPDYRAAREALKKCSASLPVIA